MRSWLLLAAGVCAFLLSRLLGRAPSLLEGWFGSGVGLWIPRLLSLATGWAPVSLSVFAVLALILWLTRRFVAGFGELRHGEESIGPLLGRGVRRLAGVAGTLLLWFYLSWGLHYARAPLEVRAGLPSAEGATPEEIARLANEAASGANQAYMELHGTSDLGRPTDLPLPLGAASRQLEAGWRVMAPGLSLPPVVGSRYGKVKALGITAWLNMWDLSGVYSPFLGEANVAGNVPVVALPAIMAHEQAHQRGFARENEATLAGMLAAVSAPDPLVRYSGWSRIIRQLAGDLRRVDQEAWGEFMDALDPGVKRDWQDLADWYEAHRSLGGPVATAVNDGYLRAHGVPGGVLNYGYVTRLLVSWSRSNDGLIRPAPHLAPGVSGP